VGPEAPEPLKLSEGFCPLVSRSVRDLVERGMTTLRPLDSAEKPSSLRRSGCWASARSLAYAGGRAKDQVRVVFDQEPRARASPRVPSRG
jgi:hypothetical protein